MRQLLTRSSLAAILAGIWAPTARGADISSEPTTEIAEAPSERVFSAFLAAGAAFVPEYEGSDKYDIRPFAIANLTWRGVELQIRGPQARLDLMADSPWDVGPIVRYRGERDDDVSGPVKRLDKIDAAVEAGGFVGYRFGGDAKGQGEIGLEVSFVHDVSGAHDGFLVTAGASYAALRWGPVYVNVDAQTTYGSKSFNRTYFGVSQSGSEASGLRAYRPDAGFKDLSAGVTAGYQFTESWGVLARAGVTRYVGDAADSPIVKDGAKTSGLLGLAVSYRY